MATAKRGRPAKKAAKSAAKKTPAKAAKAAQGKAPAAKRVAGQPATAAQQRKQLADALLALRKATVAARHATEQAHKAAAAAGQAAARMSPRSGAARTSSAATDWQDELVVFEQGMERATAVQIEDFLVELDGVRVTIELGSEVLALTEAQLTAIKNFLSAFASQQTRSAICKSKGPPG